MKRILEHAWRRSAGPIVFLTHASEMAVDTTDVYSPPSYSAHRENQRRWSSLCEFLDRNRDRFTVMSMGGARDYWESLPPVSHAPYRGGPYDAAVAAVKSLIGST
jgi:hypothetical protein